MIIQSGNMLTKVLTLVPVKARLKVFGLFAGKETLLLTNLQGPKAPLCYGGVQIKNIYGSISALIPISVSVTSYIDHFTVNFTTDEAVIKDAGVLARLVTAELTRVNNRQ